MTRRAAAWIRLLPALVWMFIQIWMGMTMAVAAPAHGSSDQPLQITVELCGGGSITLDLGSQAPDHAPGMAGHDCDWCQSFGVTVVPSPGNLGGPAGYFADAQIDRLDGTICPGQAVAVSYLSRAPPV